ncbi:hypothetical protein QFC22_005965 [Naganishia vaughanmartiniae]|uniref:Uncharacterized protein n=1 Tax=Naganishia vaughanmartiniae TaxID=1424756 RepID=A0ACC2WRC8_9TREE|nr:hypothetical protein QFC22_005965 [Naganishia vaughanmartiniae]
MSSVNTTGFSDDELSMLAIRRARRLAKQEKQQALRRKSGGDGVTTANANTSNSFSAAFTRIDTLATLRQLAMSSHQTLSPAFVRALIKDKGPMSIIHSILPPLMINTALGTLLFTSHSFFCYLLSRIDFFAPRDEVLLTPGLDGILPQPHQQQSADSRVDDAHEGGPEWLSFGAEDQMMFMEAIHKLPHPTLMSALAGAAAGCIQGYYLHPSRMLLLQRGTTSWLEAFSRVFGYPQKAPTLHKHDSIGIPKSTQDVKNFLGIGEGFFRAWQGVRWVIARDAVGYGLFFASFDVSRRAGLAVKAWLTPVGRRTLAPKEAADAMHPEPLAPTSARIAQALCLVTGGISASFLAEFIGRPIRRIEDLYKARERQASGLHFASCPTRGVVKPFNSASDRIVSNALREHGLRYFFRSPATYHGPVALQEARKTGQKVVPDRRMVARLQRFGWRLIGVGPWGFGFLIFAYLGGEV